MAVSTIVPSLQVPSNFKQKTVHLSRVSVDKRFISVQFFIGDRQREYHNVSRNDEAW